MDVEILDPPGTIMDIPFGSIEEAKVLFIKNMTSADIGVRLNGSVADIFSLATGAEFAYISPAVPTLTPLASAQIVTTASPSVKEQILVFVYGD